MYLLIFKYISLNNYFNFNSVNKYTINLLCNKSKFYFICIHLSLSQFFYTTQLVDLFSYNVKTKQLNSKIIEIKKFNNIISCQFFNFYDNIHIYLFILIENSISSLETLFLNSTWLEREYSEMSGIIIYNKTDTRNLLLQYNDSTSPLLKAYSSIGFFEIYYNLTTDSLIKIKIFSQ